ncbi:MAG TPA: response regulator transcription factor [Lacunisphaera sp.]|nr:response regulator transcription factor [Lacunisphaera sp.]
MPVTLGANIPSQPRLRVYVADNSPAMREGLARLISDECDMAVVNSAATAAELRMIVSGKPPEVLVTDMVLDDVDGLALIQELLGIAPQMRIVVFTGLPGEVYAARCLQAGARAFVGKRDSVSQLLRAIRDAADGSIVLPSGVSDRNAAELTGRKQAVPSLASELTNRELQVFRLVGQAMATKAVAAKLGVSVKTVETHRENIKNKLGLDSHAELVACAAQWLREHDGA